jgi:hypothetical protein
MRRGGMELWGGIAVNFVIYLGATSAAKARDAGGKITLAEGVCPLRRQAARARARDPPCDVRITMSVPVCTFQCAANASS